MGAGEGGGRRGGEGVGGGRAKLAWRSGGGKSRGTQDGVHKPQLFLRKLSRSDFEPVKSVCSQRGKYGRGVGVGVEGCRGGWGAAK